MTSSIDRTTSLEALSLLELPHLQGMSNLAALGLWPAFSPSSATSTPAGTQPKVLQFNIQQIRSNRIPMLVVYHVDLFEPNVYPLF